MRVAVIALILGLALPAGGLAQAPDRQAPDRRAAARQPDGAMRGKAGQDRSRGYRTSRYRGGRGATWRQGRDAHGFAGTYGGCSYRGFAGPNGYRLDKRC